MSEKPKKSKEDKKDKDKKDKDKDKDKKKDKDTKEKKKGDATDEKKSKKDKDKKGKHGDAAEESVMAASVADEMAESSSPTKAMKEWKDEKARQELVTRIKTTISAVAESKRLSKREYTTVTDSIARQYMSRFRKLDREGVEWIEAVAKREVMEQLRASGLLTVASLTKELQRGDGAPVPVLPAPLDTLAPPSSVLLPKANYLRDPYYSRRLHVPNPRRQVLEDSVENRTFMHPGMGTIRVLCAIPVKVGIEVPLKQYAVVARDWAGAFCLFFLENAADSGSAVVKCAYPILSHVEFPPTGFTGIKVVLDDIPFVLSFNDQEAATTLHDSLKMAMSSMYGNGSDDARIVKMRALSVELSSSDSTYFPDGGPRNPMAASCSILNEEHREGSELDEEFERLRVAMRTSTGRDTVLRQWVQSINSTMRSRKLNSVVVSNHLRIIEEAMRAPVFYDDVTLPDAILHLLTSMLVDQSDAVRRRIENIKVICRLVNPVLENFVSRLDTNDIPFEKCFEPVEGSMVALQAQLAASERKAAFASRYTPPGIYLSVLPYCGSQILCSSQGGFPSELISAVPSEDELDQLTPECDDFRWVYSIGAVNENWSRDLPDICRKAYDTVGASSFRAKFLNAAMRLQSSSGLPALGVIFDTPVIQREVGCGHIICVLRLPSKDQIPMGLGTWRNAMDLEHDMYLHSLAVPASSRLEYLPTSYRRCVRFIKAAVDMREAMDAPPPAPGLYLAHLIFHMTSAGPQVLVPEANRNMPPMMLVTQQQPTIAQWRWIQSLNEQKRRTQSFGLPTPSLGAPDSDDNNFEMAFATAVHNMELATGVEISDFYDLDTFIFDELQSIRVVFAVSLYPTHYEQLSPKIPMCLKLCEMVGHSCMSLFWPRLYKSFHADKLQRQQKARSTLQPFTSDEIFRFKNETTLAEQFEMDKFTLLFSWMRPIVNWFRSDRTSLVLKYGGDIDTINSFGVEEIVDRAMGNYNASIDVNLITMKQEILEAACSSTFSMTTLMNKLRTPESMMSLSYATKPTMPPAVSKQIVSARTYDDMYMDEYDDDYVRPPTVYNLPCTLEELLFKDADEEQAEKYFSMQDIVRDVVDLACVDSVDVGLVKEVGSIVNDMISILESTEDLVYGAQLLTAKEDTEEQALKDRTEFQKKWLSAFLGTDLSEESSGGLIKFKVEDEALSTALFYDGSAHFLTSFDSGVKVCLAKAMNSQHQLQQLLSVTTSTVEALDLVNTVQTYANALSHREALIGAAETGAGTGSLPPVPLQETSAAGGGEAPRSANEIILVSKEFEEFPAPSGKLLRSLLIGNTTGKARFPTVTSSILSIVANHLRTPDYNVPTSLRRIELPTERAEAALDVAIQFKAPLLTLRLATILFGSHSDTEEYFSLPAVTQFQTLFMDSFLFEYPVRDWLQIEVLGGDAIAAAMDVMWFLRFRKETLHEIERQSNTFGDHEGSWKQVFCETRIKAFLSFGVHAVTTDEVTLWAQSIGRFVEYMSFREKSVGDAEVEVLAQCCPNLKSLDLSYTSITDQAVQRLRENCHRLVECSVVGTVVSARDVDTLRRHCAENKRKME